MLLQSAGGALPGQPARAFFVVFDAELGMEVNRQNQWHCAACAAARDGHVAHGFRDGASPAVASEGIRAAEVPGASVWQGPWQGCRQQRRYQQGAQQSAARQGSCFTVQV